MAELPIGSPARDVRLREAYAELERRLRAGETRAAEAVLAAFPELAAHPDSALQMIYDELVQRERQGEQPAYEEYYQRFPHWHEELRKSFDIHEALVRLGPQPEAPATTLGFPRAADPRGESSSGRRYELLGEIGRGGMGVVYRARQPGLNRIVALKMILTGSYTQVEDLIRFRTEAEVTARLQHPNIVPVYEIGEQDGRPFLVLEYVHGGNLQEHLAGTPLPAHQAAELVATLAQAVHYAHGRGVLHRDLKPANILLQGSGIRDQGSGISNQESGSAEADCQSLIPKITDFGLAKCFQGAPGVTDPPGQTQSGAILGTPSYTAPEQATGKLKAIGPPTDVYALGAILYECLTGRPPFKAETPLETLLQVREQEPVPVRQLQPKVPRDLETIVLKAIDKEPGRRHQTAAELAEDLGRFLAGEPVRARRTGIGERGVKWVKRRPAVAALLAVSAAAALALIAGTLVHNARLGAALQDAQANLEKARLAEQEQTRQLAIAHLRAAQARRNSGLVGRRFDSLEALKKAAEHFRALGQLDEERTLELRNEAIACLALADLKPGKRWIPAHGWSRPWGFDPTSQYYVVRSTVDDRPEKGDVHQGQLSIRRVADDQEITRLPGFGVRVVETRFSPNGRYLAAHYEWGQRHNYVWDLSRPEAILKVAQDKYAGFPSFSPDSRLVALAQKDHTIRIYELPSGALWKDLPPGLPVGSLHFHPDGRQLAVVSGRIVQLRDLSDGKELATFNHPGGLLALAWRSDGKVFATGGDEHDHAIYLWDVANSAQPLRVLKGHAAAVFDLAFSLGGDLLLSNSWDSTDRLWDPMTGQQLLGKPGGVYRSHFFGPDDQGLVEGWQVAAGRECRTFHGHKDLRWVALSPRGRLMASAGADGVRLWDLAATREGDKQLPTLQVGWSLRVHFDPKGESLITDGKSAGLQRWPIAPDPETGGLRIGPPESLGLSARAPLFFSPSEPDFALSADGRTIAHSPRRGQVLVFDLDNARRKLLIESPSLRFPAFSPDGRWLATGNWQGRGVKVWDAQSGKPAHDFDVGGPEERAAWPAFSPDGKWLVTGTSAEYRFWEVGSWHEKHGLPRANAGQSPGWIVFSPDGKMLAVLHNMTEVRLVDPATGHEFARLPTAGGPYCFSPDGSQLVTYAGREGAFQVWDLRLIRQQLKEMDLDWDLPPYPPPAADNGKSLRIKVHPAEPLPPSKELDAEAHFERGLLLVQLRQHARAKSDIDRARALNPNLSRWDELVRAYSQVIERHPEDAEAYHQRAHAHERLGQWEQAIDDHSQAIKRVPQRLELLACRGKAYLRTGQKEKAAEDFRKASEQKPDQANRLARELATSPNLLHREPSLALELAKQATQQAPKEAMYWSTLGVAHHRLGEWEAALKALEEAEKLAPDKYLGSNAFFLALCHHHLGDPAKAKDYYDRAARWCQENEGKLTATQQQELKACRAEAEALLKAPPPGP